MRSQLRYGLAAIMVLSSVGIAAAAGMSNSSSTSDSLKLTSSQEQQIWQSVKTSSTNHAAPAGFTAERGATLPASIALQPIPTTATNNVAAVRPYEYAMVDQKLLIVDPTDKKVVDVITE